MAIYQKQVSMSGKWLKGSEVQTGTKAKIVKETTAQPSAFLDKNGNAKTQDVTKIILQGNPEPVNISLNRTTIQGLVDAFGEESSSWIGHVLTIETEKARVAGKNVTTLYLIPEGYVRIDNEEGYPEIVKNNEVAQKTTAKKVDDDFLEATPIDQVDESSIDVEW